MDSSSTPPDQPSGLNDGSKILIKIMSPSAGVPQDLSFRVSPRSTVGELKESITTSLDAKPSHANQRLIYRGKLLEDRLEIGPALAGNDQQQESYTIHLVVRPSGPPATSSTDPSPNPPPILAPNAPPAFRPAATFRHANPFASHRAAGPISTSTTTSTFQPNPNTRISTRTVTTSFTLPRPAGQFASPPRMPMGGSSRYTGMSLDELRTELQNIRNNPDLLRRTPGAPGLPNGTLNMPETGIPTSGGLFGRRVNIAPGIASRYGPNGLPTSSSAVSTSIDFPGAGHSVPPPATPEQHIVRSLHAIRSIQHGNMPAQDRADEENSARRRALQASLEEMQQEDASTASGRTFTISSQPTNFTVHPLTVPQASPAISSTSLVYLLQDPQGQPSALLVGPPGSAFTSGAIGTGAGFIPHNPPGAGVNAGPADLLRRIDAIREQAARGEQIMAQHGNAAGVQGGRPAGMDQIRVVDVLHGVRARAGDLWLALKLIVFVILLAGNGGWRRVLYFSSIALLIFIWQTGIFNEAFRGFADVFNPQPPANAANPVNQAQPGAAPQADTEPDPARTAQLLLERRGGRAREALRTVERGVAIFLASLVPGLHERHVRAVEQVQRAAQQAQQGENPNNENNDPTRGAVTEGAPAENVAPEPEPEPEPAEVGGAEVIGGVL